MSFDFKNSVALFGGSFHPPHIGHVKAVEGLLKNPGVQKVILLPSFGTPLKKVSVSFEQRYEMAKLAFGAIPHVEVSTFEQENRTEYTWQVLQKLGTGIKNAVFVMGTDQFEKWDQWSKYPNMIGMCDWMILLRKPKTIGDLKPTIQKYINQGVLQSTGRDDEYLASGKVVKFVVTDAPEVSSTALREKMALGKWDEVAPWLTPNVKDYILRNNVYDA